MIKNNRLSQIDHPQSIIKFREKKKWQIALRRYVLERNICVEYAPYFGLDIENMRNWFECQFNGVVGWGDFATKWQFNHIIPVAFFDFSKTEELKLCWNFTNISIEFLDVVNEKVNRFNVLAAKQYYTAIYETTKYPVCKKLLSKITQIEQCDIMSTESRQVFIKDHKEYFQLTENYTAHEFELLNRGKSINEIIRELEFLKKYDSIRPEGDNFATNV